jgi:hypothetical protein
VVALLAALGAGAGSASAVPAGAAPPLSIAVQGSTLVDGSHQVVQLRGVDEESTEYWCQFTYSWASGYSAYNLADEAQEIATWHANAVRVPLNEDCWLGINGEPSLKGDTAAGYRAAIEAFVKDLNAQGMYAILDLHWSGDGTAKADGQRQMPDDHSVAFWKSVAAAFKTNPAVLFDVFNEPTGLTAGQTTDDMALPVSWSCWRKGGCPVSNSPLGQGLASSTNTYAAVGVQALVNAIRAAGADQPIMIGGLNSANDLTSWLANEPKDTLSPPQLVASYHNYEGSTCASASCWNTTISSVAAEVPVVTGEFGQFSCPNPGFDTTWMDWADAHGVSYLAWSFANTGTLTCKSSGYAPYLLQSNLTTPEATNGTQVYNHLTSFPAPPG